MLLDQFVQIVVHEPHRAVFKQHQHAIAVDQTPVFRDTDTFGLNPAVVDHLVVHSNAQFGRLTVRPLAFKVLRWDQIVHEAVSCVSTSRINAQTVPDDAQGVLYGPNEDVLVEHIVPGVLDSDPKGTVTALDRTLEGRIVHTISPRLCFDGADQVRTNV